MLSNTVGNCRIKWQKNRIEKVGGPKDRNAPGRFSCSASLEPAPSLAKTSRARVRVLDADAAPGGGAPSPRSPHPPSRAGRRRG